MDQVEATLHLLSWHEDSWHRGLAPGIWGKTASTGAVTCELGSLKRPSTGEEEGAICSLVPTLCISGDGDY